VPHYALGVFFALTHAASGLRVVLITHGVPSRSADRAWLAGVVMSAIAAAAIIAGMCGARLGGSPT
jgi:succinate dehydrogenase hydrophobic anchor subunit